MDLEPQHNEPGFKLNLNKAFEIFGALIILTFMGVVVWQSTDSGRDASQIVGYNQSDLSPQDNMGDTDGVTNPVETPTNTEEQVFCTMDAKMCPDGSFVGREAPSCEFAKCPSPEEAVNPKSIICSPEAKLAEACTMEYRPVCGLVQIQCITTPCDPIEETFSNGCMACAQGNVDSYTEGSCEGSLE